MKTLFPKEFMHKNRYLLGALGIVLILIIAVVVKRSDGGSTITLTVPEANTQIFFNDGLYEITDQENETLRIPVTNGTHVLIAAKQRHYPWAKELTVQDTQEFTFTAFNIQNPPTQVLIESGTEEYREAQELLTPTSLPTIENRLLSPDESVGVYIVDETQITARPTNERRPQGIFCQDGVCVEAIVAIESKSPVRDLAFLPERNDVVLFLNDEGLAAIEISHLGTQNYQPLVTGNVQSFAVSSEGDVYVRAEGGEITKLGL